MRHDDVIHYQEKIYNQCVSDAVPGVTCKKDNNPCELVLYQSLDREGKHGGADLTNMLTDDDKLANDHDADGIKNDRYPLSNRNEFYNGTILPGDPDPYHQYKYGERLKYGTSVKLTCCEDDSGDYDTNGPTHDPLKDGTGVAGGPASIANIAKQRMCPPPDGADGGYAMARYGDETPYLTNENGDPYDYTTMGEMVARDDGSSYLRHCFHNRSLQSPIHFASITDYYTRNEAQYTGIEDKDTSVPYINTVGEEWNQEKHKESFYQLCVAERAKKTLCCEGTSRAPCQPASTLACRYPGFHADPTLAHCGTNADGVVGAGCDCAMCSGAAHDPDTWVPQIDVGSGYNEYFFFKEVILNVRKQRLKPVHAPLPTKLIPPLPPLCLTGRS